MPTQAEQVFKVVSALFGGQPSEEKPEVLQALLKKYLDFQAQSYFLGIHPSWLEALVNAESPALQEAFKQKNPILMQVLKTKLTRMSQQENLLETGQKELGAYLVQAGRAKTGQLLAKLPQNLQESLIKYLAKVPEEASTQHDLGFAFELNYSNSSDLFKLVGFYCQEPTQINELAQRLEYAEGQKLITILKK